jgi:hypothetical protein
MNVFELDNITRLTSGMCEEYENSHTIGIEANTRDKSIYKKTKPHYYNVKMISAKEGAKLMQDKKHLSVKPFMKGKVFGNIKEMVILNSENGKCYSKKLGRFDFEDIDDERNYKIHRYDDDRDVKEIFKNRKAKYEEIGELMNIDVKAFFYDPILIGREICYNHIKYLHGCEFVDTEEGEILDGSTRGALHYALKGKIVNTWDYDYNSMYIYVMALSDFQFPLSKPRKVKKMTNQPNTLYIVKCEVKGSHKFFARTPDNYYNSYYLSIMDILKIEYVIDENEIYEYDVVSSKEIFNYMLPMYELKAKGNEYVKPIINTTWGSLSKKSTVSIPFENLYDEAIKRIICIDPVTDVVTLSVDNRPYRHALGRMKSFILSYARLMLIRDCLVPVENAGYTVYQANTDGFISNIPPEKMEKIQKISKDIGDLKIEKVLNGTYDISHVRRIDKVYDDGDDDEDEQESI